MREEKGNLSEICECGKEKTAKYAPRPQMGSQSNRFEYGIKILAT